MKDSGQLLPRNLVEEIGNNYINGGKITGEQLGIFIECLEKQKILSLADL
jgi:hypothetical protein